MTARLNDAAGPLPNAMPVMQPSDLLPDGLLRTPHAPSCEMGCWSQ